MVDLNGYYDQSAAPQEDFGPIPAGEYEAEIIDSRQEDISKNDANKGTCLLLIWKILSGEYAGRQVWQRINLWFRGDERTPGKVVQIANAEFATVREATGVPMPASSEELHNRPCIVRVALVQDQGYAPKNEVKHVKAKGNHDPFRQPGRAAPPTPPPANGPPPAARGPAPAQSGGSAPWRKPAAA